LAKRKGHRKICPVCGQPGSGIYQRYVLNGAKDRYEPYLYFAHRVKVPGKGWTIKWCYIGRGVKEGGQAS